LAEARSGCQEVDEAEAMQDRRCVLRRCGGNSPSLPSRDGRRHPLRNSPIGQRGVRYCPVCPPAARQAQAKPTRRRRRKPDPTWCSQSYVQRRRLFSLLAACAPAYAPAPTRCFPVPPGRGDLNKINPNLKRFQIINYLRKYFIGITLFCRAVRGGAADEFATPPSVARQIVRRHPQWRGSRACGATVSGAAL
jgi:hypothetical protein